MESIIKTSGLTKQFGMLTAVSDLNLEVPKGTIFALLGPNGAGKTTTVRLLNGILKPTRGKAFLFGEDVSQNGDEIRKKCGVQTDTNLYEKLSTWENLEIWGMLFGLKRNTLSSRIIELLNMFGLEDRKNSLVGSLSKGMKQKLSIARAIIHKPEIIFLDEPTAGLDPEATEDVLQYLRRYVRESSHTVFLCSHRLEEVEELSQQVAILYRGKIHATGGISDLVHHIWPEKWVIIETEGKVSSLSDLLNKMRKKFSFEETSNLLRIQINSRAEIPEIIESLVSQGIRVFSVKEETHSLKDVYLTLVPQEKHEQPTA